MAKFAAFLALLIVGAVACSGGSSTTSPTPGSPSSSSATITITSGGVSPATVTISAGGQVTFVNHDSRNHNMQSDPHPEHTDCPELGAFLVPGQSGISSNLNTPKTCGYHDHDDFANTHLWGHIVIQ